MTASGIRVAADVGGTFTDVIAIDAAGHYVALKVPSVPAAYEAGIGDGVRRALSQLGAGPGDDLLHATTVATNAILERSGRPTGLITTCGFRDVLEIGRLRIPDSYDLAYRKPPPLVARRHRLEVTERTAAGGEVLAAPDLEDLAPAVDAAVAEGVRSFAVSLLNSYANPSNEHAVAAWLIARHPRLSVTTGTAILREAGEFERTSTAVVDAYLKPVLNGYLDRLAAELESQKVPMPVMVMQSGGGLLPADDARDHPVHVLESGPAAGALAAARIAQELGIKNAVAFDMGGTTAKACMVDAGKVGFGSEFTVGAEVSAMSRLLRGGGYTVRLPAIDLAEVGAGGGSLVRVDAAGGLQVGPQSAGADPGPACYGRGGTHPTVTDANLVLGHLSVAGLRAGGVSVHPENAATALQLEVARPLGLSVEEAAEAVHQVADQQMARALRAVTTERGRDLAGHVLIAFGGSGPVHAASLADSVGIRTVVVPPLAGILSAVGLLWSAREVWLVEPVGSALRSDGMPALETLLRDMQDRVRRRLPGAGVRRVLEMAFRGQAHELAIEVADPMPESTSLMAEFERRHREFYGHAAAAAVEVVRARVAAALPAPATALRAPAIKGRALEANRQGRFQGAWCSIPVIRRSEATSRRAGPLYIDDVETTTVVPPDWWAEFDELGNLVLTR